MLVFFGAWKSTNEMPELVFLFWAKKSWPGILSRRQVFLAQIYWQDRYLSDKHFTSWHLWNFILTVQCRDCLKDIIVYTLQFIRNYTSEFCPSQNLVPRWDTVQGDIYTVRSQTILSKLSDLNYNFVKV